jgi:TolB-like protein/Tfp pilus assembly protein PilF
VDTIEQIGRWISENESLFSGLAAIVALIAIVPVALRPILRRKRKAETPNSGTPADTKQDDVVRGSKPRLAVFPFRGSPEEVALAATAIVVTDELTALLARSRGCEVISSRSSDLFAMGGGTTREALNVLDVQYVVEGELRTVGGDLRIAARLIDTQHDSVVWTESFAASNEDAGIVSESVAQQVASHLGIELTRAEVGRSRRRSAHPVARDLVLSAQGVLFDEGHSRASYAHAISYLDQAIAADPEDAEAHAFLALLISLGKIFDFVDQSDPTREKALDACRRAIELDDRSSEVLGYAGCAYCDLRESEQGIPLLERAIELNPSNAQAKAALGTALIGQRRFSEGVAHLEDALRISPAYKGIAPWATVLASGYLRLGQLDEAAASIAQSLRCDPSFFPAYLMAAVVSLLTGDTNGIARNMREATRVNPDIDSRLLSRLMGRDYASELSKWLEEEPV